MDLAIEIAEQTSAKWKTEANIAANDETKKPKLFLFQQWFVVETYWDSPKAKKLVFLFGNAHYDRDVQKVLEQQIELVVR
jgi:IS4 transposase